MTSADWIQLVIALVLAIFAGFIAAAEAGLSSFSKSRADRLVAEKVAGARRVRQITDDPPRYLNTALFLRTRGRDLGHHPGRQGDLLLQPPRTWQSGAITAGVMTVVSYIFWASRRVPSAVSTRSRWPAR